MRRHVVTVWMGLICGLLSADAARARPPVVDVHVHTQPRRYAVALEILAQNGISRLVNLSGGVPGGGLEASLDAAKDHDDRIAVCVNVRWRGATEPGFAARAVASLERAKTLGARCMKVSKALGLYVPDPRRGEDALLAVDDPLLDPIWAAAGRLGLPVFIHTGDPKAFFEPLSPANERWDELGVHPEWSFADPKFPRRDALLAARDRVLERHRGTTFIGVHFANNPEDLDYVAAALGAHPNLYVDIAARVPEIGRHPPEKVRAIFARFQDRILFGTDLGLTGGIMLGSVGKERPGIWDIDLFYADHYRYLETTDRGIPHPTPIQGRWSIDAAGIPDAVLHKVYTTNALKLFWGLDGPTALDHEALELVPHISERLR